MKKQLAIILIFFSTTYMLAQKAKIKEGSWENLKGITEFNLLFVYSNVEIPNYESEDAFLKDKMQMREEKKPGDGERFKKSWFADRENRYEPQFIEYFNTYFKEKNIRANKNLESAGHVMKIHTTFIYPGYNVGVWRHDSKLLTTVTVHKVSHENQVLFSGDIFNIKGGKESSGFDFNSGDRIAQSYGILARYLAKKIRMASK